MRYKVISVFEQFPNAPIRGFNSPHNLSVQYSQSSALLNDVLRGLVSLMRTSIHMQNVDTEYGNKFDTAFNNRLESHQSHGQMFMIGFNNQTLFSYVCITCKKEDDIRVGNNLNSGCVIEYLGMYENRSMWENDDINKRAPSLAKVMEQFGTDHLLNLFQQTHNFPQVIVRRTLTICPIVVNKFIYPIPKRQLFFLRIFSKLLFMTGYRSYPDIENAYKSVVNEYKKLDQEALKDLIDRGYLQENSDKDSDLEFLINIDALFCHSEDTPESFLIIATAFLNGLCKHNVVPSPQHNSSLTTDYETIFPHVGFRFILFDPEFPKLPHNFIDTHYGGTPYYLRHFFKPLVEYKDPIDALGEHPIDALGMGILYCISHTSPFINSKFGMPHSNRLTPQRNEEP